MFDHMKKFMILPLVGFLGACAAFSYDLNTVEGLPSSGNAFNDALHMEYLEVARDEDKEDDWTDASYFAGKATLAAAGEAVGPQEIGERKIPDDTRKDIGFARSALVNALASMNSSTNVAALARAQAQFDCWLQEQEENSQPEDIAKCRTEYSAAMAKLTGMEAPAPAAAAAPKPKPEPMTFVVFFGHNSSVLSVDSNRTIGEALMAAKKTGAKLVQVGGHADRSGDAPYNNALSERRAKAVIEVLLWGGLDKKQVKPSVFGEDFNAMRTADGVKKAANRRVEIKLKY